MRPPRRLRCDAIRCEQIREPTADRLERQWQLRGNHNHRARESFNLDPLAASERTSERTKERANLPVAATTWAAICIPEQVVSCARSLARSQSSSQRATRFLSAKSQLAQVNLLLRNDAAKSDRSAATQCNDAAAH